MKRTLEDYFVDGINYFLLILVFIVTFYPFYYLIIISLNDGVDASLGGIYFWPRKFSLVNYTTIIHDPKWVLAFFVSVARTVVGTFLGVVFTSMVAYGLSNKKLMFKKVYFPIFIVGMYFSGGIIPLYVVLRNLHLLNTFWVYVIPSMLNLFLLLIAISFFREIPAELEESARMDGASDLRIFFSIILPISKPILATMSLFIGVTQWNSWLDSAYYVQNDHLRTLTYKMIQVINESNLPQNLQGAAADYANSVAQSTTFSLEITAMVISIVPIMCVYPFLQKYFVKGATIGAVKG
ncbi:carbohydrate ABC transporter permease [Pullulanibacillus sp. KACC 23026]|uniref:carbohydrate ABC transporter permease n=1 Tax=Pullulanibacillus sp. KACC 23026 TaxID=3028315 RepID=UPI0023AE9706|nr:carbohydrate ABC transporter permease [Pullulanibacillus sp. KACC 23026]WEG11743.1 carbohydrate ABC transporter permease [Pullulanibacillus sp. KACC 23026]